MKRYRIEWDEYTTYVTGVYANSAEEAEDKYYQGKHGKIWENSEANEDVTVHEVGDVDEETVKRGDELAEPWTGYKMPN